MKDDPPAPDHEELKALLARSFHADEADDVPPLPDDLRDRIRDQYGPKPASTAAQPPSHSFFAKLGRLFAQPAFRGAAAALVLVAVAAVLLFPNHRGVPDTTRGDSSYTGVSILLLGFDAPRVEALQELLGSDRLEVVDNLDGRIASDHRTIVLDARSGELRGYRDAESAPLIEPLPERDSQLPAAIARLSLDLQRE